MGQLWGQLGFIELVEANIYKGFGMLFDSARATKKTKASQHCEAFCFFGGQSLSFRVDHYDIPIPKTYRGFTL
jgi:hypothetical protein